MAISSGVAAPRLSPTGLWMRAMSVSAEPRLAKPRHSLGVGPAAADSADVAGLGAEQRRQRRVLELRIVGEADGRVAGSELEARQRLIRPRGDQAFGVGDALEHC